MKRLLPHGLRKRIIVVAMVSFSTTLVLFYKGLPDIGVHQIQPSNGNKVTSSDHFVQGRQPSGHLLSPRMQMHFMVPESSNLSLAAVRNEGRRKLMLNSCSLMTSVGSQDTPRELLVSWNMSLVYCPVPGAGSSTVGRALRKLNTKSPENNIDHRTSELVDNTSTVVLERFSIKSNSDLDLIRPGFKVIFTRNPYWRLWFSYLDNLYLPEMWPTFGVMIANSIRSKSKRLSLKCGIHVTFEDTLKFVLLHINNQRVHHIPDGFKPMHMLCEPCKLGYDFVGEVETLNEDYSTLQMIMRDKFAENAGLVNNMEQDFDINANWSTDGEGVQEVVAYYFDLLNKLEQKYPDLQECFVVTEVARRIWVALQFKGVLGQEVRFPLEEFQGLRDKWSLKSRLIGSLVRALGNASNETRLKWRRQRLSSIERAFKIIPKSLVKSIQDVFAPDFNLFGYDIYPEWMSE